MSVNMEVSEDKVVAMEVDAPPSNVISLSESSKKSALLDKPLGSKRSRDESSEGGQRREKRRRSGFGTEKRIKDNLISFGSGPIDNISNEMISDFSTTLLRDQEFHSNTIAETLAKCVANFPTRASIYASLVALMDKDAFELVQKVIDAVCHEIEQGSFTQVKLLLRFLFELSNIGVVAADKAFEIVEGLSTKAEDPGVIGLFLCINNLPWVYKVLRSDPDRCLIFRNAMDKLVESRKNQAYEQEDFSFAVEPESEELKAGMNRLGFAWSVASELLDPANSVEEIESKLSKTVSKPYLTMTVETSDQTHTVGDIAPLDRFKQESLFAVNPIMYPLFAPAKARVVEKIRSKNPDGPLSNIELASEAIEKLGDLDKFVLRQHIEDTIETHNPLYKETARALCWLRSPSPVEHYIMEVLVGFLMFRPRPPRLHLCYESIMIQLCRNQPEKFAAVVEDVVASFIACIRQADIEAVARFASWFAYHLSSFDLKWPWDKWNKLVETNSMSDPRKAFLVQVLERTLALSYRDDLIKAITEPLAKLIPEPETPASNSDSSPLLDFLKTKPEPEALVEWGKENLGEVGAQSYEGIMQATLVYGKASVTHGARALDRVLPLFKAFPPDEAGQDVILKTVDTFWGNAHSRLVYTYRLLVNKGVVSFPVLLKTCLAEYSKCWWMFEFLDLCLSDLDAMIGTETEVRQTVLNILLESKEEVLVKALLRRHRTLELTKA